MSKHRTSAKTTKGIFKAVFFTFKVLINSLALIIRLLGKAAGLLLYPLKGISERLRKLLRFSLTFKITTTYAFMFTILLFVSSILIVAGSRFYLLEQAEKRIDNNFKIIAHLMENRSEIPEQELDNISRVEGVTVTLFDTRKKQIHSTRKDDYLNRFFKVSSAPVVHHVEDLRIIAQTAEIALGSGTVYLQIAKGLDMEDAYTGIIFAVLSAINSAAIITALIIGSRVSRRMLLPIERMTDTVKEISAQNLDKRLDVGGAHDELKDLAVTFNEMIDRIQDSYERQNRFVSDASHELRTPVAVIQGYASLLDRWGKDHKDVVEESVGAIKGETDNMKELIEKLLFLARADKNQLKLEKEEFVLDDLLEEIAKETRLLDTGHTIGCRLDAGGIISINADRGYLKQALRVFIDNSIKYTPPGGSIDILAARNKKHVVITIADTGIGIPKEDIPFVFDRFYRSDESRTKKSGGHGLGLSIAKWIIDNHNGKIEVQSAVNAGTKIFIYLPYV
ncbi:MAG: Two-component system sensor histidine kinase [Firmicutes bacterium]|nr:Two-component system sensor histidine kinase [Bacillota bacterium]